ncbi:MAG: ATP-binding cassette domain-containing protein, partial [Pseudomonadota bacterium]
MKTILEISNLTIQAQEKTLVNDISFDINQNEIIALVGESGSGKTLTSLAIMDLLPQGLRKTGEVKFFFEGGAEQEITHLRGNKIGMIFQEPMTALNPLHNIGKQIAEAITIHQKNLTKEQVNNRLLELLDLVGLSYLKNRLF